MYFIRSETCPTELRGRERMMFAEFCYEKQKYFHFPFSSWFLRIKQNIAAELSQSTVIFKVFAKFQ